MPKHNPPNHCLYFRRACLISIEDGGRPILLPKAGRSIARANWKRMTMRTGGSSNGWASREPWLLIGMTPGKLNCNGLRYSKISDGTSIDNGRRESRTNKRRRLKREIRRFTGIWLGPAAVYHARGCSPSWFFAGLHLQRPERFWSTVVSPYSSEQVCFL